MKLPKLRRNDGTSEVIVVSGLPRSGTSMMMNMLEAGGIPALTDNIRTADEDNPKGYYEFEEVKKLPKGNTAWLYKAKGKSVKIISALLTYLPQDIPFRVIFMSRSMDEILASQKQMLIRKGEKDDSLSDIALANMFQEHIKQVFDWLQLQSNIIYLVVSYNQLLEDPVPIINEINHFLGGNLNVQKMLQIIDPTLYRQRRLHTTE